MTSGVLSTRLDSRRRNLLKDELEKRRRAEDDYLAKHGWTPEAHDGPDDFPQSR
jgi:hypothetical protein